MNKIHKDKNKRLCFLKIIKKKRLITMADVYILDSKVRLDIRVRWFRQNPIVCVKFRWLDTPNSDHLR